MEVAVFEKHYQNCCYTIPFESPPSEQLHKLGKYQMAASAVQRIKIEVMWWWVCSYLRMDERESLCERQQLSSVQNEGASQKMGSRG